MNHETVPGGARCASMAISSAFLSSDWVSSGGISDGKCARSFSGISKISITGSKPSRLQGIVTVEAGFGPGGAS